MVNRKTQERGSEKEKNTDLEDEAWKRDKKKRGVRKHAMFADLGCLQNWSLIQKSKQFS